MGSFHAFQLPVNLVYDRHSFNKSEPLEIKKMTESPKQEEKKAVPEEKDNIIVDILKKLLEINFTSYGGKGEILK